MTPEDHDTCLAVLLAEDFRDCPDDPNGCSRCGEPRRERQCYACGAIGLIIDCGHMAQPRPIAAGCSDGTEGWRDFCAECADKAPSS